MALTGLLGAAAPAPAPEPVYIVLYSRFYDHSHPHTTDERLQRLLPMLDRLRAKYPQSGISALFQFSGTVSEVLQEENDGLHLADKLKDYSRRGLIDLGYTGEEEPSYLYRPKADLLTADTPENRWAAKGEAAERFLNDFKNPVTGLPVPGLTGGLKREQEVLGPAAFISGVSTTLGGDSPATNEVRRMNPTAMMVGIPGPDGRRGIEGFGFSADNFCKALNIDPQDAPEVFWEDNVLRLSDTSFNDLRPHTADEDVEALKKVFAKLDRKHVRVIKLEVASYRRYLLRRADGSVMVDPMEWMYFHPDDPVIPITMRSLVTQTDVEAGYRRDEATLAWLLNEFLPANPGSRFISIRDLEKMAGQGSEPRAEVSSEELHALASNLEEQFARVPMESPNFAKAGDRFFTTAESFELLAESLAAVKKTGSLPKSLPMVQMYGPLTMPNDIMGVKTGSVPVAAVIKAAAEIAPRLANTTLKRVPDNTVPATIQVGSMQLNAGQFLHVMAQAYLDPSPEKLLKFNAVTLTNRVAFLFPKNTPMTDQGNAWTFKPAPLRIDFPEGVAGGR